MQASTTRIRIDTTHQWPGASGYFIPTTDDELLLRRPGSMWLVWILVLAVGAVLVVAWSAPAFLLVAFVMALTAAVLLTLQWTSEGRVLTRAWRFASGRITRELVLPLPRALWPREFTDVMEFEILHTLFTSGLLTRAMQGGHQDTLRFHASGLSGPVHILTRAYNDTTARLRGDAFTQDRVDEIEREIFPDVLAIAVAVADKVGVPLYVSEKTSWVGTDSDG